MNFFLDENFPKKAGSILSSAGHSVLDIRGTTKEGLKDDEIFKMAKKAEAVFLTTDKDFFHTVHLNSKPHFGIVVIALKQPDSKSILDRLRWFLTNHMELPIKNKCFLILDTNCIVYE